MASRLRSALGSRGIALDAGGDPARLAGAGIVFVDLNADFEGRLAAIERLRADHPGTRIVGFCSHLEKEQRRRAMAAGADHVVTNRHAHEAALRLADAAGLADLDEPGAEEGA